MKIFKFYRNDKNQEPIIVSAETYMEAANTVKEITMHIKIIISMIIKWNILM